jgi:hypothetical protein
MKIVDTIFVEAESKEQAKAAIAGGIQQRSCPEIEAYDWISTIDQFGPFYGDYEILEIAEA